MNAVILLLLVGSSLALGAPLEINLKPNEDHLDDYGAQLAEKFGKLLGTDPKLKAEFAAFEAPSKERAGGRYLGFDVRPLLLHRSEEVDFRDDGGRRDYTRTIILYFAFAEGMHKGMEETSGVFAVFQLSGQQLYEHAGEGDFRLVKHTVSAKFDGFRKTLNAEQE